MGSKDQPIIGIDLGTYNSAACVLLGGQPVMLRPKEGATDQGMCFPSFVEFNEYGGFVAAGEHARRSLPVYPQSVVCGVKRLIGKAYDAAKSSGDVDRFAYRIYKTPEGGCRIQVGRREYSPAEITALILQKIKRDAEADFNPIGRPVREAVITVPAYFDPLQKAETEQAALAAGFETVHLMPEPTAAASAYRLAVEKQNQYIAVIDLGAGTLDVTVALLYLDDNGQLQTEEKGHGGDTALGGLDMDDAILESVVRRHRLERLAADPQGRARLRAELERAKIALSTANEAQVAFALAQQQVNLRITRDALETAVRPLVERCHGPIRIALQEAALAAEEVSHVLLVGGPTMMPVVRAMVIDEFRANAQVVEEIRAIDQRGFPVHPMEAVARGAVLGTVGRITPHAYGLLLDGDYYELLPRRQRYPCSGTFGFSYSGHHRSIEFSLVRQAVDPQSYRDEYILLGAFQFDYRAEAGGADFFVEWEYTENGAMHFRVYQPSTMVHLPLYDISRMSGQRIPKPPRGILRPRQERPEQLSGPLETWSEAELGQAIRTGNELLSLAESRLERAAPAQQRNLREIVGLLGQWIGNGAAEINARTPQIRDLNRALLSGLHVAGLLEQDEYASLRQRT